MLLEATLTFTVLYRGRVVDYDLLVGRDDHRAPGDDSDHRGSLDEANFSG